MIDNMENLIFRTVLGDIPVSELGMILPHEHLFTDLRGPDTVDYAQDDPNMVIDTMRPYLAAAEDAGVTALIECSTVGVGRNIEILRRLAEQTRIHIIAPTGIYKEAFTPEAYLNHTIDDLVKLWTQEISQSIEGTASLAGFIKIAVSDDGPTRLEERNIRAAARTSQTTGAAIASHTIGGRAVLEEIALLVDEGLPLEKFIWVHAESESDLNLHQQVADLGVYVEYDFIGQPGQDPLTQVKKVLSLLEHNYGDRLLLSHDAGWFQPGRSHGQPEGGIRGYTYIVDEFIPLLLAKGLDRETVKLLIETNPKRAFALEI
jgi:phosphotriesterase-related protein